MRRTQRMVGIRRMRGGWQAYVKVDGRVYRKQFPIGMPVAIMQAWRATTRVDHLQPRCARCCAVHCPEVAHGA